MTLPPPPPDAPADALAGTVPPAVFDLAVNRAAVALRGVPLYAVTVPASASALALAQWHGRTRFARRVPLEAVAEALAACPDEIGRVAEWHWAGGVSGGWRAGKARFP